VCYKGDYAFRMNVMEEFFEIRSCIEILANYIEVDVTDYALQLITRQYILGDLHPLGGKSLIMMALFNSPNTDSCQLYFILPYTC